MKRAAEIVRTSPPDGDAGVHKLVCAALAVLLFLLYGQTWSFDYVYFDDDYYILENPMVLGGLSLDGLHWAFTTFYMSNWHPLTWLSHMLDVSLFGSAPSWAHWHNMLLHGICSSLLYCYLIRVMGSWWQAGLLAAVFLVHPLHVESVAWIAERKDLLCAVFFLAALLCYDSYNRSPTWRNYITLIVLFVLALLAKPMAVSLPVILVLLDITIYRHNFEVIEEENDEFLAFADEEEDIEAPQDTWFSMWLPSLLEKLPLIALALASCLITIQAQDSGNSIAYLEAHSLLQRWEVASTAYLTYLKQWFLPINLAAYYPMNASGDIFSAVFATGLLAIIAIVAVLLARRSPLFTLGNAWFFITLLPVIGLVQVGGQAHADRYMYLPSIGVLLACSFLIPAIQHPRFAFAMRISAIVIVFFSLLTFWQVGYWQNANTLFAQVERVNGPSYKSHLHLAKDYLKRGLPERATPHGEAMIKSHPKLPGGYQILGNAALAQQNFSRAEINFRQALLNGPPIAQLYNNLGITLAEQGNIKGALQVFSLALELDPELSAATQNLALYSERLERGESR